MRKVQNNYSEYFYQYKLDHGEDIFTEYKHSSEEHKRELEQWVIDLVAKVGEVPVVLPDTANEDEDLIALSEVDSSSIYDGKCYNITTQGLRTINRFFPEMYHVEKASGKSVWDSMKDEKFMKRYAKKLLSYNHDALGMRNMFYFCGAGWCTNFRPSTAKAIYELFGKDTNCKVLDSSAGFGARMTAAHFSKNVSEYVGIDPNTADSCMNLASFLDSRYSTGTKKKVLKMGSEDFTKESFPEYQNYFDLYFTSPPYFNTEKYSEADTQSYKKFPTYYGWLDGFYRNTIYNACSALKKDGIFIINIFEKVDSIKKITQMFLADCGWYIVKSDKMLMRSLPGNTVVNGEVVKRDVHVTEDGNSEPIWYAKHCSELHRLNKFSDEQYQKALDRITV